MNEEQNSQKDPQTNTKKLQDIENLEMWQKIVLSVLAVVFLIIGFYWGKSQVITTTEIKKVVADMTADWKEYSSEKYGFSFKYPEELSVDYIEEGDIYQLINGEEVVISIRVDGNRSIDSKEPIDAIQISIPFDKKNYFIMSTSTSNADTEIFYNIATTLSMN